jgi:farnesyl diphosphate synthase
MSNTNGNKMDKAGKRQKFLDVFPVLREELVDYVKSTGSPEEVWGWFEKVSFPYHGVVGKADRTVFEL